MCNSPVSLIHFQYLADIIIQSVRVVVPEFKKKKIIVRLSTMLTYASYKTGWKPSSLGQFALLHYLWLIIDKVVSHPQTLLSYSLHQDFPNPPVCINNHKRIPPTKVLRKKLTRPLIGVHKQLKHSELQTNFKLLNIRFASNIIKPQILIKKLKCLK